MEELAAGEEVVELEEDERGAGLDGECDDAWVAETAAAVRRE